jgi:hypothetical protein
LANGKGGGTDLVHIAIPILDDARSGYLGHSHATRQATKSPERSMPPLSWERRQG